MDFAQFVAEEIMVLYDGTPITAPATPPGVNGPFAIVVPTVDTAPNTPPIFAAAVCAPAATVGI